MNKKLFSIIGMAVSALIILFGFLTLGGALADDPSSASGAPYSYDSGYSSYSADFYTYVSNNAAEAASAARTITYNQRDLADLIKNVAGLAFLSVGLLNMVKYVDLFLACKAEAAPVKKEEAEPAEAPAPETASE